MKKVVCIDDKKLPPGAEIVKDNKYEVESEFVNNFDQNVFIIKGNAAICVLSNALIRRSRQRINFGYK